MKCQLELVLAEDVIPLFLVARIILGAKLRKKEFFEFYLVLISFPEISEFSNIRKVKCLCTRDKACSLLFQAF